MLILNRPQTISGPSPDNQIELSEWATACFKHWGSLTLGVIWGDIEVGLIGMGHVVTGGHCL